MPEQNGEKSQAPTPHRRQKAREEGQVAKSQDLGSAVLLLVGMVCLLWLGPALINFVGHYTRTHLGGTPWLTADVDMAVTEWNNTVGSLARYVLPIFGTLLLTAILVNMAQVGILFLPSKLQLDITRLDPLKGLQRIFSIQSAARLAFGIVKIVIVMGVTFASLYNEAPAILGLTHLPVATISLFLLRILVWTAIKIGVVLLLLALLDYAFQYWKHEQDLRMTQQEVREEMKNLEGDPQVIAKRRAVQRQMVMNRMSQAVPKADVVITNPTELAIAIEYDAEVMAAPIVVAKGAGILAKRIRELALENGIPIVEKKPLAQALYREVDVNHPIPADKYAAVAEVLAYVYQLQGKQTPGKNRPAA